MKRAQQALARYLTLALALWAGAACSSFAKAEPLRPTGAEILAASLPSDWRLLDPENTLYLDFNRPDGTQARVVIELSPTFAPNSVANIKTLVRAGYFDGLFVMRAQDNYVVQWGDPKSERTLPIAKTLTAEFSVPVPKGFKWTALADGDLYAAHVGHAASMPMALNKDKSQMWLTHCYGMVGIARDADADSGIGHELYAVIGHGPRHLDRNVVIVGRVMFGIEHFSTLARGTEALGFYARPEQMPKITAVKLAADLPAAERMAIEVLRSDGAVFKALTQSRRNSPGPWTKNTAGRIELCNVQIPTRLSVKK